MIIYPEPWLSDPVTRALPESRKLAVDVGANRGFWSRCLADEFAQVVAVEPDERASSLIGTVPRVQVAHYAIGETTGKATLYVRRSPDQNSLLKDHPIGAAAGGDASVESEIEVTVVSLDDLLPEGADFVKIDIEGAEVGALRGCRDMSRWARTVFLVECHDTFDAVARELERLGKSVAKVNHPLPGAHPGHCWAVGT